MKVERDQSVSDFVIEYIGCGLMPILKSLKNACPHAVTTYQTWIYDLRHLLATTLPSKGTNLEVVSKMIGHATVKLTADTSYHYMEEKKGTGSSVAAGVRDWAIWGGTSRERYPAPVDTRQTLTEGGW
jgi:integrase